MVWERALYDSLHSSYWGAGRAQGGAVPNAT